MNMRPWIDPRVRQVKPEQAKAYLLGHGWRPQPYARPQLWRFRGPSDDDGKPIELYVPTVEHGRDYVDSIVFLITALATIEDRPAIQVLDDMLTASVPSVAANGSAKPRRTPRKKTAG